MSTYTVTRTATIPESPDRVHALIDDFRQWPRWSPWEDRDLAMQRTYTGPERGLGAHYAWRGNRKAGEGQMAITLDTPERIDVEVSFLKPFRSSSTSRFVLRPLADGSQVTWEMTGELNRLLTLTSRLFSMEAMMGPDIEKGLARLQSAVA